MEFYEQPSYEFFPPARFQKAVSVMEVRQPIVSDPRRAYMELMRKNKRSNLIRLTKDQRQKFTK